MRINPEEEIQKLRDEVTQREGLGLKVNYIEALRRLTALQYFRDNWMTALLAVGGRAGGGIATGFSVDLNGGPSLQLVKAMPDWKKYAPDTPWFDEDD